MFRFRMVAGKSHVQRDKEGNRQVFKAGDVVESESRLDLKFGADKFVPMSSEFSRPEHRPNVVAPTQTPPARDQGPNFDAMNEETLRKFAEDEEIDIKGIRKGDVEKLRKVVKDSV